jgi:hypothetical protein
MKKRILMLLAMVALMVVMLAMSVAPAFAGNAFAKGRGPAEDSTNPGETVSDPLGDTKNNVAVPQCLAPKSNSPNGIGCDNN